MLGWEQSGNPTVRASLYLTSCYSLTLAMSCGGKAVHSSSIGASPEPDDDLWKTEGGPDEPAPAPPAVAEPQPLPDDPDEACGDSEFLSADSSQCIGWYGECPEGTFQALPVARGIVPSCLSGWLTHVGSDSADHVTDVAVDSTGTVWAYGIDAVDDDGDAILGAPLLWQLDGADGHLISTMLNVSDPLSFFAVIAIDEEDSRYLAPIPEPDAKLNGPAITVRKLDWTGAEQWTSTVAELDGAHDVRLIEAKGGFVTLAGAAMFYTLPGEDTLDLWAVRINAATGVIEWERQWGGPGRDSIIDLALDDAGDIYISGFTDGGHYGPALDDATKPDGFLAKLNGEDGTDIWSATLPGSINGLAPTPQVIRGAGVDLSLHDPTTGEVFFTVPHETALPYESAVPDENAGSAAGHAAGLDDTLWVTSGQFHDNHGSGGFDFTLTLREDTLSPQHLLHIGGGGMEYLTALERYSDHEVVVGGTTSSHLGGVPLQGKWDGFVGRVHVTQDQLEP
jgi:outer membrane protein assembly factor BamB